MCKCAGDGVCGCKPQSIRAAMIIATQRERAIQFGFVLLAVARPPLFQALAIVRQSARRQLQSLLPPALVKVRTCRAMRGQ